MKKQTVLTVLLYTLSFAFNIAAILTFANGNTNSTGSVWLCLGSSLLCLGTVFTRRARSNGEEKDSDKEEK